MFKFIHPEWEKFQLDLVVAAIGFTVAVLLFPLGFIVSEILVKAVPTVLGGASGAYIVVKRYGNPDANFHQWQFSTLTARVLRGVILVGLASMVFVGTATGGRTVPFFFVASTVGALVFIQILFVQESELKPVLFLAHVLAFTLILMGVALLTTPGLIGVDIWTHVVEYARPIRKSGHLSAISTVKYYAAPLYHLLIVVAAEAFGSSLRIALYSTLGIALPVSFLLVYFTTAHFLSARWSLFAVAIYSISDHVFHWGIDLIPTSMGLAFFLAVFYGVTKLYVAENRWPMYALVVFFCSAVILTHQVSAFITLAFLGAGAVAQFSSQYLGLNALFDSDREPVNFVGLFAVTAVLSVANWMFAPHRDGSFFMEMVGLFRRRFGSLGFLELASASSVQTIPDAIESMMVTVPTMVETVDSLGFILLLFIFFVGLFTILSHTNLNSLNFSWTITSGLMLTVTLGTPMLGLYTFVPSRWYAFMYVPMVVIGVFGVRYLLSQLSSRAVVGGILIFALVFPGAMLISHKATTDNTIFDNSYTQYAYSEAELDAASTIIDIHPAGTEIQSDQPYRTLFKRRGHLPAKSFNMSDRGTPKADAVVYRQYQSTDVAKVRYKGEILRVRLPRNAVCTASDDTVYTIGTVQYCRDT